MTLSFDKDSLKNIKEGKLKPKKVLGNKMERKSDGLSSSKTSEVVTEEELDQSKKKSKKTSNVIKKGNGRKGRVGRKAKHANNDPIELDDSVKTNNPLVPYLIEFLNDRIKEGYVRSDISSLVLKKFSKNINSAIPRLERKGEISFPYFNMIVSAFGYRTNIDFIKVEDVSSLSNKSPLSSSDKKLNDVNTEFTNEDIDKELKKYKE